MSEPETDGASVGASPIVAAAKDWAGKRKPADLCLELFVRLMQVTVEVERLAAMHGENLDGLQTVRPIPHPAPPPLELKQWLEQLVSPAGENNGATAS